MVNAAATRGRPFGSTLARYDREIGWVTRPAAVELQIGAVTIEIQGNQTAGGEGGRLTSEQWRHIAIRDCVASAHGARIDDAEHRADVVMLTLSGEVLLRALKQRSAACVRRRTCALLQAIVSADGSGAA